MAAGEYHFQNSARFRTACEQGATFRRQLTLLNDDRQAIDLSGYQARMQVRNDKTNSLVATLTTENGLIEITGGEGKIMLQIPATTTANYPVGIFLYDLELVNNGDVVRLIQGKFQVARNITT